MRIAENQTKSGLYAPLLGRATTRRSLRRYQAYLMKKWKSLNPDFFKDCEFRPVKTIGEFKTASRMVLRECNREGSKVPYNGRLWFTYNKSSRKATTFIAVYKKTFILGTVTFVYDSRIGLPMDRAFRKDLNGLRDMGCNMAEGTMLCLDQDFLSKPALKCRLSDRMGILLTLFSTGLSYINSQTKVDTLVACFSPAQEKFFKALLFQPLSGLQYYAGLDKHSAPGYFLDMAYLKRSLKGGLSSFYGFQPEWTKMDEPSVYKKQKGVLFPLEGTPIPTV